mmetsp:Transcript_17220/g.57045  ORF Transcript_17220/g.57045 Transcript_17220/m.57045 type:complete len:208 (-) Transcript_17220:3152-3775(-)
MGSITVFQVSDEFAAITISASIQETPDSILLLRWSPMLSLLSVNLRSGIRARGRWRASTMEAMTQRSFAPRGPAMIETQREGTMAIPLEIRFRSHKGRLISTNPSITNCPAYVPVMVELWPDAKSATAQNMPACSPTVVWRSFPAVSRPTGKHLSRLLVSLHSGVLTSQTSCTGEHQYGAKLEAATNKTLQLTRKLTPSANAVSMVV